MKKIYIDEDGTQVCEIPLVAVQVLVQGLLKIIETTDDLHSKKTAEIAMMFWNLENYNGEFKR